MIPEKDNMHVAEQLVRHIVNPCVNAVTGLNIRDFYLREAELLLPTLTDPDARRYLQRAIDIFI